MNDLTRRPGETQYAYLDRVYGPRRKQPSRWVRRARHWLLFVALVSGSVILGVCALLAFMAVFR